MIALTLFAKAAAPGFCNLDKSSSLFGLPHWWQYMQGRPDGLGGCTPAFNQLSDVFLIALAILNILLIVAGLLAVISIIIAGIEYIVATGNPEKITNARKRIINSLVGLGIAMISAAVVSFIGRQFG